MRKYLVFLMVLTVSVFMGHAKPDWGATGHRTVGEIAEQHLSRKAKRAIENILGGEGLAFVSTYGDEIKSDKKYDKYYTQHYVNFEFGQTYEESEKEEHMDEKKYIDPWVDLYNDQIRQRLDQKENMEKE